MTQDCIFCKIAKGKIPCRKVFEDDKVIAFLDIEPYSKGHLLVIPKKHSKWLWDMENEDYSYLMERVAYLATVLKTTFDTDWVEAVVAGKGVSHTHVHLFPRTDGDGLGDIPTAPLDPQLNDEELDEILQRIKSDL